MFSEQQKQMVCVLLSIKFDMWTDNLINIYVNPWLFNVFPLLQMNYNFLKQCVERRECPVIQQQWLDSIVDRVPARLRGSPESEKLLQELCKEVSDNFNSVIVKYTGISSYLCCMNVQCSARV